MVIDHILRHSILTGDPDTVQVDWRVRQNWIRAHAQARRGRKNRRVAWRKHLCLRNRSEQAGIEVTQSVVGFISVWNAVPTESQIERKPLARPPVVLYVGCP